MKLFILACFVVCAQASNMAHAPAAVSTGTSTSSRTQDSKGNYAFEYKEQHSTGGSSRQESGNGWQSHGSYSLNVGDGRKRYVKYMADGNGFRAAISTNEPGTANLPAADTSIASPYAPPQPVQPLALPEPAAPAPLAYSAQVALPEPAAPALPAYSLPEPIAVAPAPLALAPVVKAIPAVSSYSTSINHVAPAAVAEPAPLALKGWGGPAPLPLIPQQKGWAEPAPLPQMPQQKGWGWGGPAPLPQMPQQKGWGWN